MPTPSRDEVSDRAQTTKSTQQPEAGGKTASSNNADPQQDRTAGFEFPDPLEGVSLKGSPIPPHTSATPSGKLGGKLEEILEGERGAAETASNEGTFDPYNPPIFGDLDDYWLHWDHAAKEESDGMINGLKENLDNLLIFVNFHHARSF